MHKVYMEDQLNLLVEQVMQVVQITMVIKVKRQYSINKIDLGKILNIMFLWNESVQLD